MRILDYYISRRFVANILFALIGFISIFLIVDAVEKLSDYIDKGVPVNIVGQYYLYYIPEIVTLAMPIAMLLASIFSVGQLSKYNELQAMKATGISLYRILSPVFIIAMLVSIFMIYFVEAVVPVANTKRAEIKGKYIDRHQRFLSAQTSNLYIKDSDNRRIFIAYYNGPERTARNINILTFDGTYVTHRIDAESMQWEDDKWVLNNVFERDLSNGRELVSKIRKMDFPGTTLNPAELGAIQKNPLEMNYAELEQFIADVKRNGGDPDRWLVDLYLKIAFPFANFIIVLFGAPLAASRSRSTGAAGVALSLIICFAYFMAVKAGQTFGQTGALPPLVAAWLGNGIFVVGSLIILTKAPK
jgi:lipopolysaccharide export system permease protein